MAFTSLTALMNIPELMALDQRINLFMHKFSSVLDSPEFKAIVAANTELKPAVTLLLPLIGSTGLYSKLRELGEVLLDGGQIISAIGTLLTRPETISLPSVQSLTSEFEQIRKSVLELEGK